MAKDPAFLFYPGDWLGGTMGMTFEEKGAYLELLLYQFNNGNFTEAQAKQVLSICSASVFEKVLQKFNTDGKFFWKQKLSDEMARRKKFTDSRRDNAKGLKSTQKQRKDNKAYAQHMETETGNETLTEDSKYIMVENEKIFDPMPILELFDIQLNGTQKEFNNLAWRPLVPVWFGQKLGEDFKDAGHVKNSFKKFYIHYQKPKTNGQQVGTRLNLEGI